MPRPVGWRTATIEEIAEKVGMGPFGSSIKVETFVPEGIPIISGQHLHGARLDEDPGFKHISPEHAQRLVNSNVFRGDIVLTHRGTLGQVALIPDASKFERYIVSQSQFYIRCDRSKVDPDFVTLYLKSPEGQHQLLANSSQVGVPSIAQPVTYLRSIEIPIPPLPEQHDIAHVLGTLDDKIELNRRLNRTLEEMARAIFQNWFVDFGPTRAKMEGQEPYLPPDLWGLFPDELVDSEVGEIPKGWEVEPLAHLVDLNPREAMKKGTEAPYLDMASLPTDGCSPGNPVSRGFNSGSRFRNGDTLLARITPCLENGKSAYIQCLPDGTTGWGSTEFIVMRGIPPISPVYTYLLARDQSFRSHAILSMTGTSGRQRVQTEALSTYLLPIPHEGVFEAFASAVQPLFRRMEANRKETNMLSAQRDCLLPGMVSGSVPVTTIQPLD